MTFAERIMPRLVALAHELLDAGFFGVVESIMNLMGALQSGRWEDLPAEEQHFWLLRLRDLLGVRGVGDTGFESQTLNGVIDLLHAQMKAIQRRM